MAESTNQPRSTLLPQPAQPAGMSNEQLAQVISEFVKAMKEPSEEEKQKKAAEAERRKQEVRDSIATAELDLTNRSTLQKQCNHRNEKYHTFVAQNCGDGNTVAICQICRKDYKWRTTPDQIRQGVNLLEFPGLTEAHLLAWEKQFPAIGLPPDRIKLLTRAGKPAA